MSENDSLDSEVTIIEQIKAEFNEFEDNNVNDDLSIIQQMKDEFEQLD